MFLKIRKALIADYQAFSFFFFSWEQVGIKMKMVNNETLQEYFNTPFLQVSLAEFRLVQLGNSPKAGQATGQVAGQATDQQPKAFNYWKY